MNEPVTNRTNVPSPAKVAALLSKLLSEQYGLEITVVCELKGGDSNGRNEHQSNETNQRIPNPKPGAGHNRFSA